MNEWLTIKSIILCVNNCLLSSVYSTPKKSMVLLWDPVTVTTGLFCLTIYSFSSSYVQIMYKYWFILYQDIPFVEAQSVSFVLFFKFRFLFLWDAVVLTTNLFWGTFGENPHLCNNRYIYTSWYLILVFFWMMSMTSVWNPIQYCHLLILFLFLSLISC